MHRRLEEYLEEVAAGLGPLPTARRNEEIWEVRQHLENAVFLNREMGMAEDEAAATAVEQCGPPAEAAQGLVRVWRRGEGLGWRDLGAALCALLGVYLFDGLLVPLVLPHVQHALRAHLPAWQVWAAMVLWQTPKFVLAGAASGLAFPRRGTAGAAFGLAAWSAFSTLRVAYVLCHTVQHEAVKVGTLMAANGGIDAFYVVAAVAAAWAAGRWRQPRPRLAS